MTDLPISGMLDVTVDEASLRAAQQQIEDEVGDLSVGVEARGGGRGGNVAGREQAMARRLATEGNEIAESQLEELELIYERVDEIADSGDGLGGTGGGDGILGLLTDIGGDAADDLADGGAAAALTSAAGAITTAAGVSSSAHTGAAAALTSAAAALGGAEIIKTLTDDSVNVNVPDALDPVQVNDPSPLSVETPALSVKREPLPVDRTPLPVESINMTQNSGSGGVDGGGVPPAGGNVGLATPGIGHYISDNAERGGDLLPVVGDLAGGLFGAVRGTVAQAIGQSGDLDYEAAGYRGNPKNEQQRRQILRQRRGQFWTPQQNTPQKRHRSPEMINRTVRVNVNQNVEVSANTEEIRQKILRETEAMVDDIQQQVDRLERSLTNSR